MKKLLFKIIIFIYLSIFVLFTIARFFYFYSFIKNWNDLGENIDIYKLKENSTYIEYYEKIIEKDRNEEYNENNTELITLFEFKKYKKYCFCKDRNNEYKLITYFQFLCSSEYCNNKLHYDYKKYDIVNLTIWKENKFYGKKNKYIFYQGLRNNHTECDSFFNYKQCGFLTDLKVPFCIKINDNCPILKSNKTNKEELSLYINKINSNYSENKSFSLNDIISNIFFSSNVKNITPFNYFNLYNNLSENNITIIDSQNLWEYIFMNNYLSLIDKTDENYIKNKDIYLYFAKDIKKEDINILNDKEINYYKFDKTLLLRLLTFYLSTSVIIQTILDYLLWFCFRDADIATFQGIVFTLSILIIFEVFSLESFKRYYFYEIEKEYLLEDVYYSFIKSIQKLITINKLNLFFVGLLLIFLVVDIFVLIKFYIIKFLRKKKTKFVEIK